MIGLLTDRQNATIEDVPVTSNGQTEDQIVQKFSLPQIPAEYGSRSITLNHLLDFAIQFIYHEFSILTELLQKKSESDRKISLAHFARSARLIFLKLYSTVKWVKKTKKFEKLENISYFLDQQSEYFVECADRLTQIARAELIFAGVPLYQIIKAADVLSNGTYIHLPQAIKKRYIQERHLSTSQNSLTLRWLNNTLQYRLIHEASHLPAGITKVEIKNGMAIFTAPNEFIVKMTIFPVDPQKPILDDISNVEDWRWTVLDLEILVSNYEIGYGSSLIHSTHKPRLLTLCQSQIFNHSKDIENVYRVLHEFCTKIQLDILYCQAEYLSSTISYTYVRVSGYNPRNGTLNITYWTKNKNKSPYSIRIERNRVNLCAGLKLHHYPFSKVLPGLNEGTPNFHEIFNQTIIIRCRQHLQRVRKVFDSEIPKNSWVTLINDNQHLSYQLLPYTDYSNEEKLEIYISRFSGEVKCRVVSLDDESGNVKELEKILNHYPHVNVKSFKKCVQKIQIQLLMQRYNELLMDMDQVNKIAANLFPVQEKLKEFPESQICLQLILEPKVYMVVAFDHKREADIDVQIAMFDFNGQVFKMNMVGIDELSYFANLEEPTLICNRHRMRLIMSSLFDNALFDQMTVELKKNKVKIERIVGTTKLKLKSYSSILNITSDQQFDDRIECYLHQTSDPYSWTLECKFEPLSPDAHSNYCINKHRIPISSEEITLERQKYLSGGEILANKIVDTLKGYMRIRDVFRNFVVAYEYYFKQECIITSCTYDRICIAYGDTRSYLMSIVFKPKTQKFSLSFVQTAHSDPHNVLIKTTSTKQWNPHQLLCSNLNDRFNEDRDLVSLVQFLINTHSTCLPISYFSNPSLRSLKAYSQMMTIDGKNFPFEMQPHIRPITSTQIRIIYGIVHIEFFLLSGNRTIVEAYIVEDKKKHKFDQVPLFYEFWHLYSRGSVVIAQKAGNSGNFSSIKNETSYLESMSPLTPRSGNGVPTPPNSQEKVSSPPQRPMSALATQLGTPPKPEAANITLQSLLLDSNSMQNAMLTKNNNKFTSPLDEYLHSINFFFSVGTALTYAQDKTNKFPLNAIKFGVDFIEMSAVGLKHPGLTVDPWNIKIYLYLCNQTFTVRCNLSFSGAIVPEERYVQLFERYFESRVVPQNNEMGILSFVTACRIMVDGVFQALSQIMELEMLNKENEWNPNVAKPYWKTNLLFSQLNQVAPTEKINTLASSRRFVAGLMINDSCKHLLIPLTIRANQSKRGHRIVTKRIELVYVLPNNSMTTRAVYNGQRSSESDKKTVESLMIEANRVESDECRIWPAIQMLLSKYRP